ncbi:hypothetical protein BIV57_05660 [Mangrovactinospora gilvigrisea]|uniref:protein-tyrosine-phosphatase n=1 Tax=Mangrovactinospora gilvigrisea TaxID=1428644 RepID=A0A1J7CAF0_9ACTN|nr:low molecular weight protein-tyrosine-phosphatase [Mangrovactinospora gilvigrisea]OIV38488.1 hypothetical protein BIV57_05660 [Mangrovactinospora gilvigrisea]
MPADRPTLAVCFVCSGNICRSPMAEQVLAARAEEAGLGARVRAESAGLHAYHEGEPADPRTVRVLAAHGYPAAEHAARRFEPRWFDRFDHVVALDGGHLRALRRLARTPGERERVTLLRDWDAAAPPGADVPDPYYDGIEDFDEVLALVEPAVDGLVDRLRADLGGTAKPVEPDEPDEEVA